MDTAVFGLSDSQIDAGGAHWTAREILQQPQVWLEVTRQLAAERALGDFLTPLLQRAETRIVLTGAGSSAYVGACLAPALARTLRRRVEAIATTDIVTSPATWLQRQTPTLLVSFARSGNSPESLAAVELADACLDDCRHLIVTCNPQGALYARAQSGADARTVLLPEATNDRSFAMTSSFTAMLLAAALAFGATDSDERRVTVLGAVAAGLLAARTALLQGLVKSAFDRVVFLGSNELKGLAQEAALKMLELTDGKVVASADSPLGFRHGPKTFVNRPTLVVVFVSNDPYTRVYDVDLVNELRRDAVAAKVLTLSAAPLPAPHADDIQLTQSGLATASDLELCLPYAVFMQSLALLRALSLSVRPDNPNTAGTVNRVVQGVSIYPWRGAT
jgi:tagatose-6-phosphate ketose/aldose isomerase